MDDYPSLIKLVDDVFKAANAESGDNWSDAIRRTLSSLGEVPGELHDELRTRIAEGLPELSSAPGAGALAIWLGSQVEGGAPAEHSAAPILRALLKWSRTIETVDEESEVEPSEPDEETLIGMSRLGQGLVAHLSRSPDTRAAAFQDVETVLELSRTQHVSVGALWVVSLLQQCSGELIVLHATQKKGVRVVYRNIGNCFHLFSLLQGALAGTMPGARSPSAKVLQVASGKQSWEATDEAWWHYGRPDSSEANLGSSIFGEQSPSEIPRIAGSQIILLWPPILKNRSWDSGFFGPVIAASLPSVELSGTLSDEEDASWRIKLNLPEQKQSRWKFWR